LILEALQEVSKTMQTTSKKQDISSLLAKVHLLVEEQSSIKNSLSDVQSHLHQKLEEATSTLKTETELLNQQIKQLETILHGLTGYVSSFGFISFYFKLFLLLLSFITNPTET
jgi:Mg2+ and Co2+ transporter CorA